MESFVCVFATRCITLLLQQLFLKDILHFYSKFLSVSQVVISANHPVLLVK